MDIYCTRCGEPWELDTFHDVADELGVSFNAALARFRAEGCAGTGWCDPCERVADGPARFRADAMAVMSDLFGDDIDGIASDLADFDRFGWMS
jgi:hypothetical protein